MTLQMRTKCERCAKSLSATGLAFICSHECTYCDECALELQFVCKNCQGELVRRPKRKAETAASDCS
jgi:hypothetical protein